MRRPATLLALLLLVSAAALWAAGRSTELRLSRLNRTYDDLGVRIAPLRFDPVTVRLASPRQTLIVRENVVRLRPMGGGRFAGEVEIDFLGRGDLVADIDLGGMSRRMADEVLLPPQRLTVAGQARIARVAGGYRIEPEQLPESVRVEIRSRLVNEVLDLCAGAALLALGGLDCAPLADGLERPRIPLRGALETIFLADSELTAGERLTLDTLLEAP
jgi:hypothetical protein